MSRQVESKVVGTLFVIAHVLCDGVVCELDRVRRPLEKVERPSEPSRIGFWLARGKVVAGTLRRSSLLPAQTGFWS